MATKSSSVTNSSSAPSAKDALNQIEFVVGKKLEAMDYMSNWYLSKIAKVDTEHKKILIHFEGWNARYDEWVSFDSPKIRPLPKEKLMKQIKPKDTKEWKIGDQAYAKWSDAKFYPAKIVKVISKDYFEVQFDDGYKKIVQRAKLREDGITKKKDPVLDKRYYQSGRKARLAEDRASRAQRRSVESDAKSIFKLPQKPKEENPSETNLPKQESEQKIKTEPEKESKPEPKKESKTKPKPATESAATTTTTTTTIIYRKRGRPPKNYPGHQGSKKSKVNINYTKTQNKLSTEEKPVGGNQPSTKLTKNDQKIKDSIESSQEKVTTKPSKIEGTSKMAQTGTKKSLDHLSGKTCKETEHSKDNKSSSHKISKTTPSSKNSEKTSLSEVRSGSSSPSSKNKRTNEQIETLNKTNDKNKAKVSHVVSHSKDLPVSPGRPKRSASSLLGIEIKSTKKGKETKNGERLKLGLLHIQESPLEKKDSKNAPEKMSKAATEMALEPGAGKGDLKIATHVESKHEKRRHLSKTIEKLQKRLPVGKEDIATSDVGSEESSGDAMCPVDSTRSKTGSSATKEHSVEKYKPVDTVKGSTGYPKKIQKNVAKVAKASGIVKDVETAKDALVGIAKDNGVDKGCEITKSIGVDKCSEVTKTIGVDKGSEITKTIGVDKGSKITKTIGVDKSSEITKNIGVVKAGEIVKHDIISKHTDTVEKLKAVKDTKVTKAAGITNTTVPTVAAGSDKDLPRSPSAIRDDIIVNFENDSDDFKAVSLDQRKGEEIEEVYYTKPVDETELDEDNDNTNETALNTQTLIPGVSSFKAKKLRLDQITGKLSIQRQTQISAKREVIKQKVDDHLKTEEISKGITTSAYQSPTTIPPFASVPTPQPRINIPYVDRYPAPSLLNYGPPPSRCAGPCYAYPPTGACSYHMEYAGSAREPYLTYGTGAQPPYPIIPRQTCSCCSLYPAVIHESPQPGPPLVRLMQVEQRIPPYSSSLQSSSLPPSIIYTQTTTSDRPKISPKGISPKTIGPKRISPEGRKPMRGKSVKSESASFAGKGTELETGVKKRESGNEDKAGVEGGLTARTDREKDSENKKSSSKSTRGVESTTKKPGHYESGKTLAREEVSMETATQSSSANIKAGNSHQQVLVKDTTKTDNTKEVIHALSSVMPPLVPEHHSTPEGLNLSKHLSIHLTSSPITGEDQKPTTHNTAMDPDDLPLIHLVGSPVTTGPVSKDNEVIDGSGLHGNGKCSQSSVAISSGATTPVTPGTPVNLAHNSKVSRRGKEHTVAPKELVIELDHNKFKCNYPNCDKSFRKASLLESHVKYYHTSPTEIHHKRKRSTASGSEDDWAETVTTHQTKRRTKRQSNSDASTGDVSMDNSRSSLDLHSPTTQDIVVEVERDVDMEMDHLDVDISDQKEEDVIRCLCKDPEDSGLMIQCEQCFTWQHSECVNLSESDVPSKYFCYVCRNPPGLRKNARFKNNHDWVKRGILPSLSPREDNEIKVVQAKATHSLLSDLHVINSEIHALKKKIHILRNPDHSDIEHWQQKTETTADPSPQRTKSETSAIQVAAEISESNKMVEKETNGKKTGANLENTTQKVSGLCEKDVTSTTHENDVTLDRRKSDVMDTSRDVIDRSSDVMDTSCEGENTIPTGSAENKELKSETLRKDIPEDALDIGKDSVRVNLKNGGDKGVQREINLNEQECVEAVSSSADNSKVSNLNNIDTSDEKQGIGTKIMDTDKEGVSTCNVDRAPMNNLIEDVENSQDFLENQLDLLEKQVEVLENSFTVGSKTEKKSSIRKLVKQLEKYQKLGFVC